MLNYIWVIMLVLSLIFAVISGKIDSISSSVMTGAETSVQFIISVAGTLCFWSGMMQIAEESGITKRLSKVFAPILSRLFKNVPINSNAMKYISLNISANMLGLGNAATPFGLSAMKELKKLNGNSSTASDDMLMFVVFNTASVQLIPTTLFAYRTAYGSIETFAVLPCIWLTSVVSLFVGITTAKCLSYKGIHSLCH